MKIYADMLFAINFSMDFISLFITSIILQRKVNKKRLLLASAIGGVYGVFEVISSFNSVVSVFISIVISFLMCFVTYSEKSIKRFVGIYVVFLGISACLGGVMSIMYSFMNRLLSEYIESYTYNSVYTGARFFIIAALSIIASLIFGRFFITEKKIKAVLIEFEINNRKFSTNALCDSGNLLTEPISGKSVILIAENTNIGKEILAVPDVFKRYIPYEGVGGSGMIKGIVPKNLWVNKKQRNAVLATISKKDFAGYEACISSSLI